MATTLPVGSGQTYTTPEGAIAAIPAVLLDDYVILLKDIAEYVYTANSVTSLSITGYTNAGKTISMYPDTGKAFKDNFVYGTDAIKYTSAKGACFRSTGTYSTIVGIAQDRVIIRDLMMKSDSSAGSVTYDSSSASSSNCEHTRLILDDNTTTTNSPCAFYGAGSTTQNIIVFRRNTGTGKVQVGAGGAPTHLARFITLIRDSGKTAGGTGFFRLYNCLLNNCVEFGYTTASNTFDSGSGNNASDLGSGFDGSGNVYNITNACWTGITAATLNLTVAAGCVLAGAGTNIAAVTTDILGAARPNPPAIGALEPFTGGGGGFTPKLRKTLSGLGTRVGSRQVHGW